MDKDKKIRIDGLNKEQATMLETMWNIDSSEDFSAWMLTLTVDQVKMALTLKDVLVAHVLDEINDTSIAKQYLERFRL